MIKLKSIISEIILEYEKGEPLSFTHDCVDSHRGENYCNLYAKEYEELLKKQNHVCKICGNPETAKIQNEVKSLAVDHCHRTNVVRGLLCSKCNTAIGLVKDNTDILSKMIDYLKGQNT